MTDNKTAKWSRRIRGQDIPYPLSVPLYLFFVGFFGDTKRELSRVWVRFWVWAWPRTRHFFFVVAACVFCFHLVPLDIACGLLAVRANSSVQQSRTGNFVIQNTTDYRSFRLLTHTHRRFGKDMSGALREKMGGTSRVVLYLVIKILKNNN